MDNSTKSCRCCMKPNSEIGMVNILEATNLNGLQLTHIYLHCTGIQISANEPLPLDVCELCVAQLNSFNNFRETCIQSDRYYRSQFAPITLKHEPGSYVDDAETNVESIYQVEPTWLKEGMAQITYPMAEGGTIKCELSENQTKMESLPKQNESDSDDGDDDDDSDTEPAKQPKHKKKKDRSKSKVNVKNECFTCTFGNCTKKFFVKRRFEGHMRQHEGLKAAICTFCNKQFAKWISHDQHVDAEHSNRVADIKCDFPDCLKTFTTKIYKARHIRSAHTHRQKPPTEAAFICHECGKAFVAFSRLKEHLYTHMPNMEKPHKCQQCGKGFIKKHKLKNHIMRHEGIKNFICPHCGMRKTTKEELRVHINCHTREKTYKCTHCEKEFSKYENMKRHVKVVHEGIRAFHCTYCDQSFGKAETLKHHIMTHTGEKPHKCTVCDRGFIQQTALKTHMQTHLR